MFEIISDSVSDTRNFGKKLAKSLKKGQIFALNGNVGCGKTEFIRGVLSELNPEISVLSPTFSIVNSYETKNFTIHHFDFYRIKNAEEFIEIGFDEYLNENSVVFVEWAQMFKNVLGENCETVNFSAISENSRKIESSILF
ncbi:MAG: tRNA (adenosine(37)-N6)-threonylcarbamoyltransferase complex ATPase subunit type 1 TsaE [Chitinispirillales bacterium]|jgi:tRNA threonylcarbamoyladenosine biosynthesis protein TsaE|nr:tRNA (adenosine(37)-N6)-threonylcarbamoyltransferase complex ATPase subunit type 1 TsaE [Chitinispirillales bacterium]